ncbi:hypothetical protein QTP88_025660 [Uroleucon formosanum]
MSRETHRTRHRADAAIREKRPEKCKVFPGMMANLNSSFGRSGVRQKRVKRCEADVDVDVSPGRAQRRGGELRLLGFLSPLKIWGYCFIDCRCPNCVGLMSKKSSPYHYIVEQSRTYFDMNEYVKSSKGKDLLVFIGYVFEQYYTKNGITYWECLKCNTGNCLGQVHTKDDLVVHHKYEQNHIPNTADRYTSNFSNPIFISSKMCYFIFSTSYKKKCRKNQMSRNCPLPNLSTLAELILIEPYARTLSELSNDPLILSDSGVGATVELNKKYELGKHFLETFE